MSSVKCNQQIVVLTGEDRTHYIDFTDDLSSGETLSSPVATDYESTGDLTISSVAVNTATFENIDRETVAIGKGVQFKVSGASVGRIYTIKILADTTESETVGSLIDYTKAG